MKGFRKERETHIGKRLLLMFLLVFFASGSVCYASESRGIHVAYHTQQQIRDYLKKNKVSLDNATEYGTKASIQKPYRAGTLKKESLQSALAMMNAIRYIAGIDANVTLDDDYTRMAQAAALVNAANGNLTHYPDKPEGMSDSLYELGKTGAASSNIAWTSWETSLSFSLVCQWMEDGDAGNISRVGHRRWILNPSMEKTGFGWVSDTNGTYTAMYAFDNAFGTANYYGVAWPAQNMPVEYFGYDYPWSISMGDAVDKSAVKVTLTRLGDRKKWIFSEAGADGYFNVENSNYGRPGCIIFRPSGAAYQPGDKYQVEIAGLAEKVSYQVQFFSLGSAAEECDHSFGSAKVTKKATLTENGAQERVCEKCGETKTSVIYKASKISLSRGSVTYNGKEQKPRVVVKDSRGKAIASKYYAVSVKGTPKKSGCYQVTVRLKGNYSGAKKLTYTVKPKAVSIKKTTGKRAAFAVVTQKGTDITGYEISYSTDKNFRKAKTEAFKAKGAAKTSNQITKRKRKQTYYVRVRTYKTVTYNGKKQTLYSAWSKAESVKTK